MILSFILSFVFNVSVAQVPHLEMEMSSSEYEQLLNQFEINKTDELTPILDLGKRNLQWLDLINQARAADKKIELSTEASQIAYPIDSPALNNRTLIKNELSDIKASAPQFVLDNLFGSGPLEIQLPMSDDDFIVWIRRVDRLYQRASRWLLEEPYLDGYASLQSKDVRGYYFLKQIGTVDLLFDNWMNIPANYQTQLSEWLVGICINSVSNKSTCENELAKELQKNKNPIKYYNKYMPAAEKNYNNFFNIDISRSDVTWNSQKPEVMSVPFVDLTYQVVKKWLVDNVEDEWKSATWQLKLNFVPSGNHTFIEFVPGTTPHVDTLGGNKITMDANRNIQEYTSRWTIRHEYGHTLGFPDCYVEFYNAEEKVMINYQIDTSDLMCSRRGKLKARHISELKKIYFKN